MILNLLDNIWLNAMILNLRMEEFKIREINPIEIRYLSLVSFVWRDNYFIKANW